MTRTLLGILLFGLIASTPGCLGDADRGNPLDPLSPNFLDEGQVGGRVADRSLSGIGGGTVTLSPGGLETTTDNAGNFLLGGVPSGSYTIISNAAGYAVYWPLVREVTDL